MSPSTLATHSAWLVRPDPKPQARLRLLCVPYAGVGASVFRPWPALLPPEVELVAIELPGRGTRLREAPYAELAPLVEALLDAVAPVLDRPWAVFGHSMGALVAFALVRALRWQGRDQPVHLFVSARRAPRLPDRFPPLGDLPDAEFVAEIQRRFDGIPPMVLREPDLLRLLLPTLRADVALLEHYVYREEPPLALPITALGGREDDQVDSAELEAWREQTQGAFSVQTFPGDHFFVQTARTALVAALVTGLAPWLSHPSAEAIP